VDQNPLPHPSPYDRVRPWLPWLVFFFALAVRLPGIGWGLPNGLHNQSYHPDEQVIFSFSQQIDVGHGKLLPGDYHYGSLYLTLLSLASKVIAGYGGGAGATIASFWAFVGRVDLAGRILNALAGAGTALVLFLMLRRQTGMLGSLAGALFIALAPGFVVHSRFQTVDVLATFLLTLSLYYCTLLIPSGKDREAFQGKFLRFAVLAGLFAGLSAGTKYTGILALVGLWTACMLSGSRGRFKAAAMGTGAALAAFFLSTPGAIFDSRSFWRDFRYEMIHTSTGHDLLFVDVGNGFVYHLVNLTAGLSPLLFLLSAIGLIAAMRVQWPAQRDGSKTWFLVLAAFSLVYYILIGRAEVLFLRYTLPLYIVLAASFGWWMGEAHARSGSHRGIVALGILSLGMAGMATMQYTSWMAGTDPRDVTALELRSIAKSKPNTTVGIVSDPWYYTPPLIPDGAIMRGLWPMGPPRSVEDGQIEEMAATRDPHLEQAVDPALPQSRFDWDSRLVSGLKPDYIVYSSFEQYDVNRLQGVKGLDSTAQLRVDRYRDFQKQLSASYKLDSWEQPDFITIPDLEYVHPYIYLWKRNDLN